MPLAVELTPTDDSRRAEVQSAGRRAMRDKKGPETSRYFHRRERTRWDGLSPAEASHRIRRLLAAGRGLELLADGVEAADDDD